MSEAAEAIDVSDSNLSIDDSQIDKFFESGGNEELLSAEKNDESSQQQQQEVKQEEAQQAEQKEQAQKQEKMVPYGAMHEERMRRQELQREIEQYKQRTEKMEQAFQQVLQRAQPQERVPTFEEDPLEALRYNQTKLAEVLQNQHQTLEQQRAAATRDAQIAQFQSMCNRSVAEFEKTAPDYKQAYQWLVEKELKGYETLGYDQETAVNLLRDNEMALAATAFKQGFNPAERIYNYAKLRGWNQQPAAKQINEADKITKKLETIEKGIQASKSLGSAGGGAAQPLTLEALASMDGDELDEVLNKDWEKLMKMYKG